MMVSVNVDRCCLPMTTCSIQPVIRYKDRVILLSGKVSWFEGVAYATTRFRTASFAPRPRMIFHSEKK
jgi:hypothetical protein